MVEGLATKFKKRGQNGTRCTSTWWEVGRSDSKVALWASKYMACAYSVLLPVRCPTRVTITDSIPSQHSNPSTHPRMTDGASGLQDDDTLLLRFLFGSLHLPYYPPENGGRSRWVACKRPKSRSPNWHANLVDWMVRWLAEQPPKKDFRCVNSMAVLLIIYCGHAVLRGCFSFCDKSYIPEGDENVQCLGRCLAVAAVGRQTRELINSRMAQDRRNSCSAVSILVMMSLYAHPESGRHMHVAGNKCLSFQEKCGMPY